MDRGCEKRWRDTRNHADRPRQEETGAPNPLAHGHERPLICNVLAPDPGVLLQRQAAGYALALVPDLAPRAAAASIAHVFETLARTGAATVAMSRAELDDAIGGPAFRARAADYAS